MCSSQFRSASCSRPWRKKRLYEAGEQCRLQQLLSVIWEWLGMMTGVLRILGDFTPSQRFVANKNHISGWRRNRLYYKRFGDQYCLRLQGDFLMSRGNRIQFSVHHNIAKKKKDNFRKDLRHTLSFKRIKSFRLRASGWSILLSFTIVLILTFFLVNIFSFDSVGTQMSYGLDDQGSIPGTVKISPRRPHRLWGPSNLLFNRYRGLFPRG
jgi:hypothetical protein